MVSTMQVGLSFVNIVQSQTLEKRDADSMQKARVTEEAIATSCT